MDCKKIGNLIKDIRNEKQMTQKQLADKLNVSDKAISKWERGLGCPDVSLLKDLSKVLGVDIDRILSGDLDYNPKDIGNIHNTKFYVCPICNNILTSSTNAEISCCGRNLMPLVPKQADMSHKFKIDQVESDYLVEFSHEMSKEHYISFIAYVACDKVLLVKLYPEQDCQVRFPIMSGRKFYYYCNEHGLFKN